MKQHALTIVARVALDQDVGALEASLDARGEAWKGANQGPFADLETLHYLGCCVVQSSGVEPALVVLELSFDGGVADFLATLVGSTQYRDEIDEIFASCEGYPGPAAADDRIVDYMKQRNQRSDIFYLGHPGRSVKQIKDEEALREDLLQRLENDRLVLPPCTTRGELWKKLRSKARGQNPPKLPLLVRYSLQGLRGPKRVLELVLALAWVGVIVAGVLAFCAFALHLHGTGNHPAFGSISIGLPILLSLSVGLGVLRQSPKHLKEEGRRLVLRGAVWQGWCALVFYAVVVGVLVSLLPPISEQWAPGLSRTVGIAALWAVGLVLTSVLLAAIATMAYVLAGRIAGLLVGVFALGVGLSGFEAQRADRLSDAFVFAAPVVGALLVVMAGAVAAGYLHRLRKREREDAVAPTRWDNHRLAYMTRREDRQYQNHFASVTTVKDEVRLWQLGAVCRLVNLLARILFNLGSLGAIPSIHFARFIILDGEGGAQNRLLFLTNYDGAWAHYLGEFSHVLGVTLIWGNTELFPRPFLVADDGARDEQRFKTWARTSQTKTLLWYSAYPELGVAQVNRNTQIRQSLARPLEDEAPRRLGPLLPLWRYFKRPLTEAALDAELRSLTN